VHAGAPLLITSTVGSQTSGAPGTSVTISAPAGSLTPGSALLVTMTDFAHNPSRSFFPSQRPAPDGSVTIPNLVLPPHAAQGPLTITLTDSGTPSLSIAGAFTIVPVLTFAGRADGNAGDLITVVGDGFATNAPVTFAIGGIPAASSTNGPITATATGVLVATLVVPAAVTPGQASLVATDGVGTPVTLPFTIDAPPTPAGTATIAVPATNTPTLSDTPTASATGTVTATATATAPTATLTASATSTPAGTVTIQPAAQTPGGAALVVAPAGMFPGSATVTLLFLDASASNPARSLGTAQTAANGSLSQSITVPAQTTNGRAGVEVIASVGAFNASLTIEAALMITPTTVVGGSSIALSGDGFGPLKAMAFTLNGAPLPAAPVTTTALGHFTASITLPSTLPSGTVTLGASDGSAMGSASVQLQVSAASPTPTGVAATNPLAGSAGTGTPVAPSSGTPSTAVPESGRLATPVAGGQATAYFAEGFTGNATTNGKATFTETLALFNPNADPASATITYFLQGSAAPRQVQRMVAGYSVLRESVNSDVGPDQSVSVEVSSPQTLLVARTITRASAGGTRLDGSQGEGIAAAATQWGFPEGYTGGSFQEYLSLLNPGASPAQVTVLLAPQGAGSAGARRTMVVVPAAGRATVNIRALNQHGAASVGLLVGSDVPVVAERVEYFGDGAGSGKFGSVVSPGFTAPATSLRLAYGSSGGTQQDKHGVVTARGNQMYVTLLNPSQSGAPVRATVTIADAAGNVVGAPYTVSLAPATRQTVALNLLLGSAALSPFSVGIQASGPIEAEGTQYFGGSPNKGRHPGVVFPALAATARTAYFPDISTRLPGGAVVHRLVYVYAAATQPLQLQVAYFGQKGPGPTARYTAPGGGILTIDVNSDTAGISGRGPIGMSISVAPGSTGTFLATMTGITSDGLSALEGTALTGG
jgi:hypothetical protein